MRLPSRPTIYEINTAVWLGVLGRESGGPVDLASVPAERWDALAALPVDAVWLMGVWERSPAGLDIALADAPLVATFRAALPDMRSEDVIGSPYCVRGYTVDERFGGPAGLAAARAALAERGVGLILDFVPNHVAADHDWTAGHPDYFIRGTPEELASEPLAFVATAGGVLANGKDPYFAPWHDVVQLNAFAPGLRDAVVETLVGIGDQCDGVRCDMAMLMTNEVFARTWGERAGPAPEADYWPTVIGGVRQAHPDMLFMAEAYWDMEYALQRQGFDLCYDKRLYDRLVAEGAESVRGHLGADREYQEGLVRFIENHDEPRAAATFPPEEQRAAAVVMSTLQGARMWHDGQFEGFRTRIPVQLDRGPGEPVDEDLRRFYVRLAGAVADSGLRDGAWRLCDCTGWPDNDSFRHLLAWCWDAGGARSLVVVNLSSGDAQGRVRLPWDDIGGRTWTLSDRLSDERYERDGGELRSEGLYVGMAPWEAYFLALDG